MCGRMLSTSSAAELVDYFDVDEPPGFELRPDYNVAPTRDIAIVRDDHAGRHLDMAHWGLVPGWAKDPSGSSRLINARAETVASKPSFRAAFKRKRCIVPADGFYEWQAIEGQRKKQPYLVTMASGTPLAFAGLWETWRDPDGEALRSCTIITCPASTQMAAIHHRMPVLLEAGAWDVWLDTDVADRDALEALLVPAPDDMLELRPVSTAVNNVRNNSPDVLDAPSAPSGNDGLPGI